jgi:hypothetical protein
LSTTCFPNLTCFLFAAIDGGRFAGHFEQSSADKQRPFARARARAGAFTLSTVPTGKLVWPAADVAAVPTAGSSEKLAPVALSVGA